MNTREFISDILKPYTHEAAALLADAFAPNDDDTPHLVKYANSNNGGVRMSCGNKLNTVLSNASTHANLESDMVCYLDAHCAHLTK